MTDEKMPGMDAAVSGWSKASKNMQTFAGEVAQMSMKSYEHATETVEKLRGARSMEDLFAIQSTFVKESMEQMAERGRRLSEMMASVPMEMAKSYSEAMTKSMEAMKTAGVSMADKMPKF